jgi:cellulose synthase/poly-beta-1,6-N-acetylglucosamine synthase-like glycosyltransferase
MIVNDQSSDRTKRLLEDLMASYPKLRSVTIKYTPKHVTAKKFAITLGIKVAKNDIILLTDADTLPENAAALPLAHVARAWLARPCA